VSGKTPSERGATSLDRRGLLGTLATGFAAAALRPAEASQSAAAHAPEPRCAVRDLLPF